MKTRDAVEGLHNCREKRGKGGEGGGGGKGCVTVVPSVSFAVLKKQPKF